MSYIRVPLNTGQIYPLNKHSYLESVVRNLMNVGTAGTFFGFIGPHGKRLNGWGDANGKDFYYQHGSIQTKFAPLFGNRFKRWQNHFDNALANGLISYRENHRHVVYPPVVATIASVPNVITKGDLVWWDAVNDSVRSATAYPWTTNLATTQSYFSQVFLGVAMDPFPSGQPSYDPYLGSLSNQIRVDVSPLSFWDFTDQLDEIRYAGDIMAPAKNPSSNALLAQTLIQVAPLGAQTGAADGIARVARVDVEDSTSVLVHVQSAFWGHEASDLEGS